MSVVKSTDITYRKGKHMKKYLIVYAGENFNGSSFVGNLFFTVKEGDLYEEKNINEIQEDIIKELNLKNAIITNIIPLNE